MIRARPLNFRAPPVRRILDGAATQERRFGSAMFDLAAPGDLFWVREPFAFVEEYDGLSPLEVYSRDLKPKLFFPADGQLFAPLSGKLRPARTLPRRANRLVLKVTAVDHRKVQDWTAADSAAVGLDRQFYAAAWDAARVNALLFDRSAERGLWADDPVVTIVDFQPIHANIDRHLKNRPGRGCASTGPSEPAPVPDADEARSRARSAGSPATDPTGPGDPDQ